MTGLRNISGLFLFFVLLIAQSGCEIMPVTRLRPVVENPYPELQTIAVLPFHNQTDNPDLNEMEIAQEFASELQKIEGFTVLSVYTVAEKMVAANLSSLKSVDDVRILGRLLGADAVVVGRVNSWTDQTPLQFGITTEWYATNQYFQPTPVGHGLPWGTTREEEIPLPLISATERELAKAQLATQTPDDPEGEAAYLAFREEWERKMNASRFSQRTEPVRSPENANGAAEHRDRAGNADDFDYEDEAADSERENYQKLQQESIDRDFTRIHGDKTTIKRGMHNLKINTRNAEEVRKQIAELLKDEDPEIEVGVPRKSPLPDGLEDSEWIKGHRHRETLQEQMHRTNKPEIPQSDAQVGETGSPAFFPQSASFPQSLDSANDFSASSVFHGSSGLVYPPNYGGVVPPYLDAARQTSLTNGYGPHPTAQYPNVQFVPVAITTDSDSTPQKYGILIQGPVDPNDESRENPTQGGDAIFLEVDSQGGISRAFPVDPNTGELGEEISPAEIGFGTSALPTAVLPIPAYQQHMPGMVLPDNRIALEPDRFPGLPENWPDPRGFISDGPRREKPKNPIASRGPICALTRHYSANDSQLTQALEDFHFHFRDNETIGGWQMILRNRKAFIAFCCRMHIWEILSARGGAREAVEVHRTWKTWNGTTRP